MESPRKSESAGATTVPVRSALVQVGTIFGTFAAGPLIGMALAEGLAPGAPLASVAVALAYGATLRSLAAGGWLPFPEPE